MKKLLALVLVLGLAVVANAGLTLDLTGGTISIMGDGVTAQPLDVWLVADGAGTVSGGIMVYSGSLSSIDNYAEGDGSGIVESFVQPVFPGATTAIYANFANSTAGVLSGTLATATAANTGTVTYYLMSNDLGTTYDSITVPEPITLALLGLGGLFIRRK